MALRAWPGSIWSPVEPRREPAPPQALEHIDSDRLVDLYWRVLREFRPASKTKPTRPKRVA